MLNSVVRTLICEDSVPLVYVVASAAGLVLRIIDEALMHQVAVPDAGELGGVAPPPGVREDTSERAR